MKTVMDAVIELRGSIGAVYDRDLCILYHAETVTYSLATMDEYERLNYFSKSFTMVCPLNTFNATVTLLSHAPWIKGASLEEYQAANKEVLKMESKTVEVSGMVYEIGKLYLFSDGNGDFEIGELSSAGDINDGNGFMYQSKVKLRKSSKYEWWCIISKIDTQVGTITPAPVKLIDGNAYSFEYRGKSFFGIYSKKIECFYFGEGEKVVDSYCTSIVRLAP